MLPNIGSNLEGFLQQFFAGSNVNVQQHPRPPFGAAAVGASPAPPKTRLFIFTKFGSSKIVVIKYGFWIGPSVYLLSLGTVDLTILTPKP